MNILFFFFLSHGIEELPQIQTVFATTEHQQEMTITQCKCTLYKYEHSTTFASFQAPGDADPAPAERFRVGEGRGQVRGQAVRALRHPRLRRLQRGDVARAGKEALAPVRHAAAPEVQEGVPGTTDSDNLLSGQSPWHDAS